MELLFFFCFLHGVYVFGRFIIVMDMSLSCKYLIRLDMTGIIYFILAFFSFFFLFINKHYGWGTVPFFSAGGPFFRRHLLFLFDFVCEASPGALCFILFAEFLSGMFSYGSLRDLRE